MRALHFGAGNIGRGFIGKVLSESGYHVTFVDVNQGIIDQINQDNYYKVRYIEEAGREFDVSNVEALHSINDSQQVVKLIGEVDLITTSVGVDNLPKLVKTIITGLSYRNEKPIDIICNENSLNATDQLKTLIESELQKNDEQLQLDNVGFLNSAIDRQAMNEIVNGKDIAVVEPFFEWVIESTNLQNKVNNEISGAHYVSNIMPFIERKLFIVNSEHAISAYLGSLKNLPTIQAVLADPQAVEFIRNVLNEHAEYLKQMYQMDDLEDYINTTLQRHGNKLLADDIHRVGRNPLRKLSNNERIVGPVEKLVKLELPTTYSIKAIAVGLKYRNPEDSEAVELEKILTENQLFQAISKITGITNLEIIEQIASEYNKL